MKRTILPPPCSHGPPLHPWRGRNRYSDRSRRMSPILIRASRIRLPTTPLRWTRRRGPSLRRRIALRQRPRPATSAGQTARPCRRPLRPNRPPMLRIPAMTTESCSQTPPLRRTIRHSTGGPQPGRARRTRSICRRSGRRYCASPAGPARQLIEGSIIQVRLLQRLSTAFNEKGESFRTQSSAVLQDGDILMPAGPRIDGHIVEVSHGTVGGHGVMRLVRRR